MARPRPLRVRSAAVLAAAAAVTLLVGGGCELAIGDAPPAFACIPGPDTCPANQVCDPHRNQCVPVCTASSCRGGMQCASSGLCADASVAPSQDGAVVDAREASQDTGAGTDSAGASDRDVAGGDETAVPSDSSDGGCRGLLCQCAGDSACDSHVCAGELNVGPGLFAAAGSSSFCTTPCCTSTDCGPSLVCYATSSSASAGNYCVPPQWLMRSTTLGTGQGGQSCTTDADCRSGLCNSSAGICADTCCSTKQSSMECAAGTSCGFDSFVGTASFDKNYTPVCGKFGTVTNGDNCNYSSDCQSNLCADGGGGIPGGFCQDACRSSSDCAGTGNWCSYDRYSMPGASGVYGLCFPFQSGSADGDKCQHNTDCQSNFCDPLALVCSNICFSDSDCTVAGWHCRPEQVTLQRGGGAASVLCCGT